MEASSACLFAVGISSSSLSSSAESDHSSSLEIPIWDALCFCNFAWSTVEVSEFDFDAFCNLEKGFDPPVLTSALAGWASSFFSSGGGAELPIIEAKGLLLCADDAVVEEGLVVSAATDALGGTTAVGGVVFFSSSASSQPSSDSSASFFNAAISAFNLASFCSFLAFLSFSRFSKALFCSSIALYSSSSSSLSESLSESLSKFFGFSDAAGGGGGGAALERVGGGAGAGALGFSTGFSIGFSFCWGAGGGAVSFDSAAGLVVDDDFRVIPSFANLSFILFSAFSLIFLALSSAALKPEERLDGSAVSEVVVATAPLEFEVCKEAAGSAKYGLLKDVGWEMAVLCAGFVEFK